MKAFNRHRTAEYARVADQAYRFKGMSTRNLARNIIKLEKWEERHRAGYELSKARLELDLEQIASKAGLPVNDKLVQKRTYEVQKLTEYLVGEKE